ncbi:hypothetical protein [Nocardia aurantia]|uniref:Uncharacterized protein n=1 Tax=Nocardia aurantia TaxID=2585199 RepID=A0A7K0DUH1_9NOCA|nr:hypothetical protein [Nocardia aurantia]MQY29032.1 hypothetical protein [Nocardia aurantia]
MSTTIARLTVAVLLGALIVLGGNGIRHTTLAVNECHEGFCEDSPKVPVVVPGSSATVPVAGWQRLLSTGSAG